MGIPCGGGKLRSSTCRVQLSGSICVCVCNSMDRGRWVGKNLCLNAGKMGCWNAG